MQIKVLGSAAAEGWPALFCECDICKYAWKHKGKDVRRRTSYLLNDDVMIDYGPDVYGQSLQFDIDLSNIGAIFFTHSHDDHCDPVEFAWRRQGFSVVTKDLHIYANQTTLNRIQQRLMNGDWERYHIIPHLTLPGVPFQYKQYKVMPILAQHAAYPELPLNYIIQDEEGKTALIGNDTGWWCDASWEHLKAYKLDIAIIEATMGPKYKDHNRGQLGTGAAVTVRDELKRLGVIDDNTLVAVNHFSHNGLGLHKDMEAFFNPQGIQVCYDGYVLKK